jgi:hypothetical protein
VGTKKARQAVRKAAAIASKEEEEEESILSKLPFVIDEKGEVNAVKVCCRTIRKCRFNRSFPANFMSLQVLEAGAWLGIFSLVAWEFYINSPLFDRAGPMAPVIYDKL